MREDTLAHHPHGDYDPRAGSGNPNCTCASACFYIWAAGADRDGDVVVIHRPYFNTEDYEALSADEAKSAYTTLEDKVREFLVKVGVSTSVIEKMMSVDLEHGLNLSADELRQLRFAPYWQELKLANCPADDVGPPDPSATAEQRLNFEVLMQGSRETCWSMWEQILRTPLITDYLERQEPDVLPKLYLAKNPKLTADDIKLYQDCQAGPLRGTCLSWLQNPASKKPPAPPVPPLPLGQFSVPGADIGEVGEPNFEDHAKMMRDR